MLTIAESFVTVDVREGLCAGREPLRRVMEAAGRLREGVPLRVIAPFRFVAAVKRGAAGSSGVTSSAPAVETGDFPS